MPKKRNLQRKRLVYNKKLLIVIIILIVILIILLYVISILDNTGQQKCFSDSDCVPATCCHPDSCVVKEQAPLCKGVMCTMICSGPLDCGAGTCGCINGKCTIRKK